MQEAVLQEGNLDSDETTGNVEPILAGIYFLIYTRRRAELPFQICQGITRVFFRKSLIGIPTRLFHALLP
jgi:hypothetical protein